MVTKRVYVMSGDLDLCLLRYMSFEDCMAYSLLNRMCRALFLASLQRPWSRVRVSAVLPDVGLEACAQDFIREHKPHAVQLHSNDLAAAMDVDGDWSEIGSMGFRSLLLRTSASLRPSLLTRLANLTELVVRSSHPKHYRTSFSLFHMLPSQLTRLDLELFMPFRLSCVDLTHMEGLKSVVIDYGKNNSWIPHTDVTVLLPPSVETATLEFGCPAAALYHNPLKQGVLHVDTRHCTGLKSLMVHWADTVMLGAPERTFVQVCSYLVHHRTGGDASPRCWYTCW
ncbi:hypothetical protein GHT06_003861 [Daphnia sinensis]|uniref:Uncharacterized protein n=1 Tax=Daphnia sinensis TaxID=1820382 RepID=A0AAD5PNK3_9CRUS|nr:hypothetical protein GHT06_003861 [Daphnia sinensis]